MTSQLSRNPPFRAEHLGSLLRPKPLLEKRVALHDGKTTSVELKPIEDEAIKSIVKTQEECGFHAISDGEYRFVSFPACRFNG